MNKKDLLLEDLESLGLRHISLNDCDDANELENLCERIKQSLYQEYKNAYNDF
jgi:hypothetical protein